MKRIIHSVLLILTLCLMPTVSFSADDEIWVAVTVVGLGNFGQEKEYHGQISQSSLQQLTSEVKEGQLFKLTSAYWLDEDGQGIRLSEAKKHGHLYGYTNDVFLRADQISRIIVLDEKFVKQLLKQ